ncbi:PKD domain-containing protein [Neolewinella antarctica]|uniref:PKD repeat protein n=1 Tax=Neolewinella antarctica TaxID=442734 RepID=A0ABX0XBK8_9BACT|nr:PKD domain-containing protein [Neolewinella antarctica]NJC26656.1 PKD repeat protein [Neolewinella antarctica]
MACEEEANLLTAGCDPISTLPCSEITKLLPFSLVFDGTEGGLTDRFNMGTGFTMAVAPSFNEYPAVPSNASVPGFESSLLSVTSGNLELFTTKGTAALSPATTPGTNNQVNMLGAGFQAPGSVFELRTELDQPQFELNAGNDSQEGGLWYGLDEDNYVKLVVEKSTENSQRIRLTVETTDPNDPTRVVTENLNSFKFNSIIPNSISLRLEIDPVYRSVRGYYAFDGGTEAVIEKDFVDSLALPQVLGLGVDHDLDASSAPISYGGVFATQFFAPVSDPTLFQFKSFDVEVQPFTPTLIFDKSELNISVLEGEAPETSVVTLITNNSTDPVITLSDDPHSAAWLILPSTPTTGEVTFGIQSGLAEGRYSTTIFATSPGFLAAELVVNLVVSSADNIPRVLASTPADGAINVTLSTSLSGNDLFLPNGLNGIFGVENSSITNQTVKLFKVSNNLEIPATVNGTGGGDGINLTPTIPLEINTTYRFVIDGVKDLTGVSFEVYTATFTTAADNTSAGSALDNVSFTNAGDVATDGLYSSLSVGPDGKLYGLQLTGNVDRWTIAPDGKLGEKEEFSTLPDIYGARSAIGLAFDPAATESNLIVYVSHAEGVLNNGEPWDGKISRLTGPFLQVEDLVVTRLPRSRRDHLTNGIAFRRGEGSVLYFNQGSNSAGGAPDNSWGNRKERLLTAATLRLDLNLLPEAQWPLDAKTTMDQGAINNVNPASPTLGTGSGTYRESNRDFPDDGTYNPFYVNAPLTIFATGIRNAYDLVWHSNGQLYIPNNGTAGGSNTPASVDGTRRLDGVIYDHDDPAERYPPIPATFGNNTQRDFLFRVDPNEPTGYYGHPNPLLGHYVLNRGPVDVRNYDNNVSTDVDFRGIAFDFEFNKSPNGIIEYQSGAEGGNLRGALLVCRYSGGSDIIALIPNGPNGDILTSKIGIPGFRGFGDPLDITEDPATGNLYVSDLAKQTIVLLKPSAQAAPQASIEIFPENIVTEDVVGFGPGAEIPIFIVNTGNAPLTNPLAFITGKDSLLFQLDESNMPETLDPNSSTSITIRFNPDTVGPKSAKLIVSGSSSTEASITLNGMGTKGYGGDQEPSLQQVLDVYELNVRVADQDENSTILDLPVGTEYTDLVGDELFGQTFQRATPDPVTIEVLGVFSPEDASPIVGFGWYQGGISNATEELFTVDNSTVRNGQTLNPVISGSLSFDPGLNEFGFYNRWPMAAGGDTYVYTEDFLNAFPGTLTHHARVYEVPNQDNTFAIAFEGQVDGADYQDIVLLVRNVETVAAPLRPVMVVNPGVLYPEGRNGQQGYFPDTVSFTVQNTGTAELQIRGISFAGQHAELVELYRGSDTVGIAPGGALDYEVIYRPSMQTNDLGHRPSRMIFNVNTSGGTFILPIDALTKRGNGGGNEPSLQTVVDVLRLGIDVGWTTVSSDTEPTLKGEEVLINSFEAAGPGPVTLLPVARYSPTESIQYGWYTDDNDVANITEVGVMSGEMSESQTLFPSISSGSSSFDYEGTPFGIYITSNIFNHTIHTKDSLNAPPVYRRARIYPVKDTFGNTISNQYLVAFEDALNGDYQDYVFLLKNAREYVPVMPSIAFDPAKITLAVSEDGSVISDSLTVRVDNLASANQSTVALTSLDAWLAAPVTVEIGESFALEIDAAGLQLGMYAGRIVASGTDLTNDTLTVSLAVVETLDGSIKVNFQDPSFTPPVGYFADYGDAFGNRAGKFNYGWVDPFTGTPSNNYSGRSGVKAGLTNDSPKQEKLLKSSNRFNIPGFFTSRDWEVDLRNGLWAVRLAVGNYEGDSESYAIKAEGVPMVSNFNPTVDNFFQIGYDTIRVQDGKLTLSDGNDGLNGVTKLLFVEAVPVDSTGFAPSIVADITGNESLSGSYYGAVLVTLNAFDRSGSGGVAGIRYRINGGNYQLYTGPFTLTGDSDSFTQYRLEYDATDGSGNTGYGQSTIRIEPQSGAIARIENMIKIPGTDIGFPSDDFYSFNKILGPVDFRGDTVYNHLTTLMRIHNDGTETLVIDELTTSDTKKFIITKPTVSGNGISIAPGDYVEVEIKSVSVGGNTRVDVAKLMFSSNADNSKQVQATFSSIIGRRPEGTNEANVEQIFSNFGFGTKVGRRPDGRFVKFDSNRPSAEDINSGYFGDAIFAELFEQADVTKPVQAMRIAAFHGPGGARTRFTDENDEFNGGLNFTHLGNQNQSVFPKTNFENQTIAGKSVDLIPRPFQVEIADYHTTGGNARQELKETVMGMRIYRVLDRAGNNVPNAYLLIQDYVGNGCDTGAGNCDFNDNIDIVYNARPLNKPEALGIPDKSVDILTSFRDTLGIYFDKGYPGNRLVFSKSLSTGGLTPSWISLDSLTGMITVNPPYEVADQTFELVITAVDYNLLEVKDTFKIIVNPTSINCTVEANSGGAIMIINCANPSVTLNGFTSSGDYLWTGPSGFTSMLSNPTVSLPGTYTLSDPNEANNCPLTSDVIIVQGQLNPEVAIIAPRRTVTCSADSLELTAASDDQNNTFTWYDENNNLVGVGPSLFVRAAGTYRLVGSNNAGCFGEDTIVIDLDLSPQFAGNDGFITLCESADPVNLYTYLVAQGGQPYQFGTWMINGQPTLEVIDPSEAPSGDYLYVVGGSNGCSSDTAIISVTIDPATTYYADLDFDGLGDPSSPLRSCSPPDGYVDNDLDNCPNNGSTNVADFDDDGTGDLCDDDDDNDGIPDDLDCDPFNKNIGGTTTYYADFDRDGLGDNNTRIEVCGVPPADYVLNSTDNCPSISNPNQTDIDNDGVGDVCDASPAGLSEFWLEAECAVVGSEWLLQTDSLASNGEYAVYVEPKSLTVPEDVPSNRIRFTVDKVQAGDYYLFARVSARDDKRDSYWVRINGGVWFERNFLIANDTFEWNDIAEGSVPLNDGVNTIDFSYRERDTKLDKIYLSMDPTVPTTIGGTGQNCAGAANKLPIAVADVSPLQGFAPLTVNLDGRASFDLDTDGSIVSYGWTWESGAVVGDLTTAVIADTGFFNIVLTVTDNAGDRDTDTVRVRVNEPPNIPPVAIASSLPTYGIAPLSTTLDGSLSSDIDGSIISYQWSWSTGSTTGKFADVSFPEGNYTVTLTVTDDDDDSSTSTVNIVALNASSDDDDDNIQNDVDNCPTVFNPDQSLTFFYADNDLDGFGDPTDSIAGCVASIRYVANNQDNCPTVFSSSNRDTDGDGLGDACDDDDDNDGILDTEDCEPLNDAVGGPISYFSDVDGDGIGDSDSELIACTPPTGYVAVGGDNCPTAYNPDQSDFDQDGKGDYCDSSPNGKTDFWLEAECAVVGSQWEIRGESEASNSAYAIRKGSSAYSTPGGDPSSEIKFFLNNVEEGDYHLFAHVKAKNASFNSYWVRINDGPWVERDDLTATNQYAWNDMLQESFYLENGENTITFSYREINARLDKILLSTNSELPTVVGVQAANCTNGNNQSPIAIAKSTVRSGETPLTVSFDGSASFDPDVAGRVVSYAWTSPVGDNVGANIDLTFTTPGTYPVVLTVADDEGAFGTDTIFITAQGAADVLPVAVATASPERGAAPLEVVFDGRGSYDPNGTIEVYEWTLPGMIDSGDVISATFPVGSYEITLTVTDSDGDKATTTVTVEAIDPSLDTDNDGVNDAVDNCPTIFNPEQITSKYFADFDNDGLGDPLTWITGCEIPDGYVIDSTDNCPTIATLDTTDTDSDGVGNECDEDDDGDGILDADDCDPLDANVGRATIYYADIDSDGFGDDASATLSCSPITGYVLVGGDNCPDVSNPDQSDSDEDGTGDVCDASVSGRTSFWLESECALVGSSWTTERDFTASNDGAVRYQGDLVLTVPADTASNHVRFDITDAQQGDYHLFARVKSKNASFDSYFVRVNDGLWFERSSLITTNTYEWNDIFQESFSLLDGVNTITFAFREPNARLDKIYLSTSNTVPTAAGPVGENCGGAPNQAPIAIASSSDTFGFTPLSVTLDGTASYDPDAKGSIISYDWTWPGGSAVGVTPAVTFLTAGVYDVTLTVTDDGLAVDEDVITITVVDRPNEVPVLAAVATPNRGIAPLFTELDASGSFDPDGTIQSYSWNWNGGSADGITVTNTFTTGFYDITLTVTDNEGATADTIITVQALNPDSDTDNDGFNDDVDNCPAVANPDQIIPIFYADLDEDGLGDPLTWIQACVAPDGYVADSTDNCPQVASLDNTDTDGDGVGDLCDEDDDNDGVLDVDDCEPLNDNVGNEALTYYDDLDGDGFGDDATAIVSCTPLMDYVTVGGDNCPNIYNRDQLDSDQDGKGDVCDASINGRTDFWLESECAQVGSSWSSEEDFTASNDGAVRYQGELSLVVPADTASNHVTFRIMDVQQGDYYLFARVKSKNSSFDSYYIRVNGGPWFERNDLVNTNRYAWNDIFGDSFTLPDGVNTITFAFREPNARLDKIYLSTDGTIPAADGPIGENCGDLSLVDTDGDNIPDNADSCPTVFNADQLTPVYYADFDRDGFGDPNDSIVTCEQPRNYVINRLDNCPAVQSSNLTDTDKDGIGDVCDTDSNGASSKQPNARNEGIKAALDESAVFTVFPNPVIEEVNLRFTSGFTGKCEVTITDVSGRVMVRRIYDKTDSRVSDVIEVSHFESGPYVIQLISGDKQYRKLFIKVK